MNQALKLAALLDKMWADYLDINPEARSIYQLFLKEGERIENDHIALRTFNHPRVSLDVVSRPFLLAGYVYSGDYHFPEKKLYAKHYQHPDPTLPKIFISELLLEKFSPELQKTIHLLVDQIPEGAENQFDFVSSGRPWNVDSKTYQNLLKESEYAAWVAAFGYRPNHFTVFVNKLKKFNNLTELNSMLKAQGYKLNASGGEIKGSREVCLEQSSTMANSIEVSFSDKVLSIPACYYEFAKRYPMSNGELYQGFVAASADKIFESTNR